MGYRSDVAIGFDKPANALLEAYASFDRELSTLLRNADSKVEHDTLTKYYWAGEKWYDTYPEVATLQEIMELLPLCSFGFLRIGEDYEDIEEHGHPADFDIWVSREISF